MPSATSYATDHYDNMGVPYAMVGLLCVALAMQPGTGGLQTIEYYRGRDIMGYPLVRSEPCLQAPEKPAARTPAEDLEHIRAFLRPSVADLAYALGVSRQAVYDWQAGKPVAAENALRLADFGRAADVLAAEGVSASAQLVRRPIQSGQTLLDIVRSGGSAEQVASVLAGVVRREAHQRDKLAARLVSRPGRADDLELGAPMLDEVADAAL